MAANTMECPQCHSDNLCTAARCVKCDTPFALDAATMVVTTLGVSVRANIAAPDGWSLPSPSSALTEASLAPGTMLGSRYEIVQLLGQGGMGAVYKAKDRELDRLVALKVIRPEMAANPEVLRRFKQELILARQITHRNVIRIFDLGEAENIKFITMEYIEGRDLKSLIVEKGKLSSDETIRILEQVCLALEAAHAEGVVHRDLKPQNIMVDNQGKAAVMDFGIARSVESGGMTQTGMLMGTPDYMSPEQVMGEHVDARSDLFTLGVILYELLAGVTPYKSETTQASMFKRLRESPRPLIELEPTIPQFLSGVATKCLQIDRASRYQSAREILQDLQAGRGGATISLPAAAVPGRPAVSAPLSVLDWLKDSPKWLLPALAAVLAASVFVVIGKGGFHSAPKQTGPPISLAILPFRNASGDASLDWLGPSLSDMLSTDVGQSAQMRMISPDRLHQVLADLQVSSTTLIDPTLVGRIAEFSSADTIVSGEYAKFGDQIRVDAVLQDLKHERRTPLKVEVATEKDIPKSVDQLAGLIRTNLSVSSDVLKELKASSFQPTSNSVPALRDYSQGLQLLRDGKNLEALKAFQSAILEDPNFALADSRLAETDSLLGYDNDAEQASNKSVGLSDQLPAAERYLINASHARIMKDNTKAIEAYQNLTKLFPDSADIEYDLGSVYMDNGQYANAQDQFTKILKQDPKNTKALWQSGVVDMTMGNPQAALDPLTKGLSLTIQEDNQEQKALILLAMGIAYRLMNKPAEAMQNYQQSMEITKALGLKRIYANSLTEMALVQNTQGKPDAALDSYTKALQMLQDIGMQKERASVLIDRGILYESRGDYDKALGDYKDALQVERDANDQNLESVCLNNIGGVYLTKGDTDNALTYLQQSLDLRQKINNPEPRYMSETLDSLGEVYCATGQYDKALSSFMSALDVSRRASNLQDAGNDSDEIGKVFRYQGRLGASVNALQEAVKDYRTAGNRGVEMGESLSDLADSLALAGRGNESSKVLEEGHSVARDLKNSSLDSDLLNADGDVAFYRGDTKTAQMDYSQALAATKQSKAQEKQLVSRLNLAKVAIAEGRSQSAMSELRAIVQQANGLRLKYLSLEGSVDLAEAMISVRDYAKARQDLEYDLSVSEKMGLRIDSAKIHYLLATALRSSGTAAESGSHYQQARQILETLKAESGADHILDRSDLHVIYAQASRP